MDRDMDLVRLILLAVADKGVIPVRMMGPLTLEGYPADLVSYHVWMLEGAGLIEAVDLTSHGHFECRPRCLTWHGHEFLDSIRDPEVWRQTKAGVEMVGGFSLDILSALARGLIRKKIEEHTGISLDL